MLKPFSYRFLFFILTCCSSQPFAGGPLVLEGPTGNTPVRYQDPNITVHLESGPLGALSNEEANALVEQAFALWDNVNTATLRLITDQTQLVNIDIDINNFDKYLPNLDGTEFNADDNLNPIVYDSSGEIIDAFFGPGQSEFIIGFAASVFTDRSIYFKEGYAVINGKDLGLSETTLRLLISHEIAHFFGLDHSQVNIDNNESGSTLCTTGNPDNYPVMYPFICRNFASLHSDDISAISALYPAADIEESFGILGGRFVGESGAPILGANIWLENTVSGDTYSIVSDYLKQGNGFYILLLPAGTYSLHANSINPEFNGGSGIGPYATDILDLSFIDPHPITPVSWQDDSGNTGIITISSNQIITLDFSSTGSSVALPDTITIDYSIFPDPDSITYDDGLWPEREDSSGAASYLTLLALPCLLLAGRRTGRML